MALALAVVLLAVTLLAEALLAEARLPNLVLVLHPHQPIPIGLSAVVRKPPIGQSVAMDKVMPPVMTAGALALEMVPTKIVLAILAGTSELAMVPAKMAILAGTSAAIPKLVPTSLSETVLLILVITSLLVMVL